MNSRPVRKHLFAFSISLLALILIAPIKFNVNILPITLQTFVLALIAYWFRWSALIACICYIIIGLFGFPVFSGFAANTEILSTTSAGFVIGFPVFVIVIILLKNGKKPRLNAFSIFVTAHLSLLLFAFLYNTLVGYAFPPKSYILMPLAPALFIKSGIASLVVKVVQHKMS
jgi:biotin transport system substrate-specific component